MKWLDLGIFLTVAWACGSVLMLTYEGEAIRMAQAVLLAMYALFYTGIRAYHSWRGCACEH